MGFGNVPPAPVSVCAAAGEAAASSAGATTRLILFMLDSSLVVSVSKAHRQPAANAAGAGRVSLELPPLVRPPEPRLARQVHADACGHERLAVVVRVRVGIGE